MNKQKSMGQVYTPNNIVNDILNLVNYKGDNILKKHIIDNSCGNGRFLCEIVKRYIIAAENKKIENAQLKKQLEKYIHGIEIDRAVYEECIKNLNSICHGKKIYNVKWDILNMDSLKCEEHNAKMDFVVGNPPYVRVHNLQNQYDNVKEYKISEKGMTDLYIVFFQIGFDMLSKKGKMSYITPNSFYNSIAGRELRECIYDNKNMFAIMELGHYQPFSSTTYTTITAFDMSKTFNKIDFYRYEANSGKPYYVSDIKYSDLFIGNNIVLADKSSIKNIKDIVNVDTKNDKIVVKNGFATLADDFFIKDKFDFREKVIDVIKASTGKWKKCIFPYDKQLKPISLVKIKNRQLKEYFLENKEKLIKRSIDKNIPWNCFGRSQAILDVPKEKIAINTTIKDKKSIKLNKVMPGQGVYSGLYILTDYDFETIKSVVVSDDFVEYIKSLSKYKSGGYYTYSSGDLKRYLLFKLGEH